MPTTRGDSSPDAVVVGSGHNGLVAANDLADAGWDVLVCEATDHVGGAVRSAEVTAPGFTSDLFSAFYPLAAASPVIRRLGLDGYGLRWSHAPDVVAQVLPDGRAAVLSRDVERSAASMAAFAPGDGDAWRALVAQWDRISPDLLDAVLRPFPPVRPATRLVRRMGTADTLRFVRQSLLPVRRLGEELFSGEGAPLLIAGNALHADLSPDAAGSGLYGWLLTMLGQTYGFPVPVGGAGRLTQAMADRLTARGGSVRVGAPVEQVLVSGGVATGVRLSSGELVHARRAVLADIGAPLLYEHLVEAGALPPRLLADLKRFQWDTPTMKIDWALSSPVPWSNPDVAGAGTVQLGVDMDGLTDYMADLACRRIPSEPLLLFGQMTTSDASRSPAGTESVWGYTHLPPGRELTAAELAVQVDRVEDLLERHAPGFRSRVVGRDVRSPTGLEDRNPNLVHGAINGGTAQIHQQLVFRPVPGLGRSETPVDRLYLAGSAAHPGGGVHGAAGANAARAALLRAGRTGAARRQVIAALHKRIYAPGDTAR